MAIVLDSTAPCCWQKYTLKQKEDDVMDFLPQKLIVDHCPRSPNLLEWCLTLQAFPNLQELDYCLS